MFSEIKEMPLRAQDFLRNTKKFTLPLGVPYIGMGSSYFAPLCFKYMGMDIYPEMASEFFNYLHPVKKWPTAVLLSQSGKSSEVLWCSSLFEQYTAITNDSSSPLAANAANVIQLQSGEEKYSSSKTYLNTLLALFTGFGIDVKDTVALLQKKVAAYEAQGRQMAEEIYTLLQAGKVNGLYITGSGPNVGTALQAALIMSETTKLPFNGMALAQYDHGPKETANNSIIINILSEGKSYDRTKKLAASLQAAGARVFTVEEPAVTEDQSVIPNIVVFNYLSYYLSQKLGIADIFVVGGKVTEVEA
ncbi:MAG TPA: hypothetical protein VL307_11985 [Chitinophagaceae bacterium]|nr:hypothetical protein [Chitinophagaceae bacterium]